MPTVALVAAQEFPREVRTPKGWHDRNAPPVGPRTQSDARNYEIRRRGRDSGARRTICAVIWRAARHPHARLARPAAAIRLPLAWISARCRRVQRAGPRSDLRRALQRRQPISFSSAARLPPQRFQCSYFRKPFEAFQPTCASVSRALSLTVNGTHAFAYFSSFLSSPGARCPPFTAGTAPFFCQGPPSSASCVEFRVPRTRALPRQPMIHSNKMSPRPQAHGGV